MLPEAAERHHDDDLDRLLEAEVARRDRPLVQREQRARDAAEERADDERGDLVVRRVDADGGGGDLVLAHGHDRPALRASRRSAR